MIVLRNHLDCNIRICHDGINVLVPAGAVADVKVPDSFEDCKFLQELLADKANSFEAFFDEVQQDEVQEDEVQQDEVQEKTSKKGKKKSK